MEQSAYRLLQGSSIMGTSVLQGLFEDTSPGQLEGLVNFIRYYASRKKTYWSP
jgi:hypothetical protein